MFWVIVLLLIVLGLAFILLPLLSTRKVNTTHSRTDINRSIYHAKVSELQADMESGLLDQNDYESALQDLQQTLIEDAETENNNPVVSKRSISAAIVIIVLLPLVSVLLYEQISTQPSPAQIAQQQAMQTQSQSQIQTMEASIASLEAKLQDNPDNFEGWIMLGQSYFVMRNYTEATNAYLRASELVNNIDPDVLVQIAESSAFSNGEQFGVYENNLLSKALQIDPKNERALWYAGFAAYKNHDYAEAVKHWEELIKYVPNDRPDVKQTLTQFLNDARQKAGLPALAQSVEGEVTESEARTIKVSVDIDEAILNKANPNDTLFVYARAVNGPKMPLSLARLTVSDLPASVTLSKEMAMMPNMDIDTFEQVEVLARVSKSGQAITQPGDLISQGVLVDFSQSLNSDVSLTINSVTE